MIFLNKILESLVQNLICGHFQIFCESNIMDIQLANYNQLINEIEQLKENEEQISLARRTHKENLEAIRSIKLILYFIYFY